MPNNKIHCRLGRVCVLAFCVILVVSVLGCATEEITLPGAAQTMQLSSPAFGDGERIPAKYTCDAEDISPPLTWTEPPPHTQAFVLIMDDPDAPGGTFTHWVLFNLPAATRELAEATPDEKQVLGQALQGTNSFGRIGYDGPCPPRGHLHRYRFTLYALDQPLNLEAGASREQVLFAIKDHILALGQLTVVYQRQQ